MFTNVELFKEINTVLDLFKWQASSAYARFLYLRCNVLCDGTLYLKFSVYYKFLLLIFFKPIKLKSWYFWKYL